MSRALHQVPIALALSVAQAVWAASPDDSGGRTADHLLRLRFEVYSTLPAGSIIICKARLGGAARSGPDEATAGATVAGGSASRCAMEIAVHGSANRRDLGEVLRYEIEAEEHPGGVPRMIAAGAATLPAVLTGPADLDLTMQISPVR